MVDVISARGLRFSYDKKPRGQGDDRRLTIKGINLGIKTGSTVGIVGESGSGKSTLVRVLCGLLSEYSGSATYEKREIVTWIKESPTDFRAQNQIIFQSPASSFDPKLRIVRSLAEPIKAIERRSPSTGELVSQLVNVGLGEDVLWRYPHQLSGGQLQRVAIARALGVRPRVLYADEPTSALDVSVQAQVLNLLMDIRARFGLTLVMVSHDLAVVSRLCEWIVIMQDGRVVEEGETAAVMRNPSSAHTRELIEAADAVSLQRDGESVGAGHDNGLTLRSAW